MAKLKEKVNEKKELGTGKIILIVFIVFTFIPITIMGMLYFSSKDFQFTTNEILSTLPGSAGQYFDKFPTRAERESQKKDLAQYLLDIDTSSATDKLLIIQNSDSNLYTDIISLMSRVNSRQTEKILERVRENSIKQDVLVSTISQIKNDELDRLKEKAQYYEKQDILDVIIEIKEGLQSKTISYNEIASILSQMKDENAARILSKLDQDISTKLLSNVELEGKKLRLNELVSTIKNDEKQLINVASIYNTENSEKAYEDLSANKKYSINQLSVIYRNMDKVKAAQVLSKIEDKNFVFSLIEQIKSDEILENGVDNISSELVLATSILEEYNRKVAEFVGIASKMEVDQILQMINKLYESTKTPQTYVINDEDSIIITDRDLAVRILSELQPKKGAEVLSMMDPAVASEISKIISLPSLQ